MFCNKCGHQVNASSQKCQVCGSIVDISRTCGGFWNLVGENTSIKDNTVNEAITSKPENLNGYKKQKVIGIKRKPIIFIPSGLCIVLLIIIIILVTKFIALKSDYDDVLSDNKELKRTVNEINERFDEIDKTDDSEPDFER